MSNQVMASQTSQSNSFFYNSATNRYEPCSYDNNFHNLNNNNAQANREQRVDNNDIYARNGTFDNNTPPYAGHPYQQFISFSNASQNCHHQSNVPIPAPASVSYGSVSVPSLLDIVGAHTPVSATNVQATSRVFSATEEQLSDEWFINNLKRNSMDAADKEYERSRLASASSTCSEPNADITEMEQMREYFLDTLRQKMQQSYQEASSYINDIIVDAKLPLDLINSLLQSFYSMPVSDMSTMTPCVPKLCSTSFPPVDNVQTASVDVQEGSSRSVLPAENASGSFYSNIQEANHDDIFPNEDDQGNDGNTNAIECEWNEEDIDDDTLLQQNSERNTLRLQDIPQPMFEDPQPQSFSGYDGSGSGRQQLLHVNNDHILGQPAPTTTFLDQDTGSTNGNDQNVPSQPYFCNEYNDVVDARAIMLYCYYTRVGLQLPADIADAYARNFRSTRLPQFISFPHPICGVEQQPEPEHESISTLNNQCAQGEFPQMQRSHSMDSTSSMPGLSLSNSVSPEPSYPPTPICSGQVGLGQNLRIQEFVGEKGKGKAPAPASNGRHARQLHPYPTAGRNNTFNPSTSQESDRTGEIPDDIRHLYNSNFNSKTKTNTNAKSGEKRRVKKNEMKEIDEFDAIHWIVTHLDDNNKITTDGKPRERLRCPICPDFELPIENKSAIRHIITHSVLATVICCCGRQFARIDSFKRHVKNNKDEACVNRGTEVDIEEKIFNGFMNELKYLKSIGCGRFEDSTFLVYYANVVAFRRGCQVVGGVKDVDGLMDMEGAGEEVGEKEKELIEMVKFLRLQKLAYSPEFFDMLKRFRHSANLEIRKVNRRK